MERKAFEFRMEMRCVKSPLKLRSEWLSLNPPRRDYRRLPGWTFRRRAIVLNFETKSRNIKTWQLVINLSELSRHWVTLRHWVGLIGANLHVLFRFWPSQVIRVDGSRFHILRLFFKGLASQCNSATLWIVKNSFDCGNKYWCGECHTPSSFIQFFVPWIQTK